MLSQLRLLFYLINCDSLIDNLLLKWKIYLSRSLAIYYHNFTLTSSSANHIMTLKKIIVYIIYCLIYYSHVTIRKRQHIKWKWRSVCASTHPDEIWGSRILKQDKNLLKIAVKFINLFRSFLFTEFFFFIYYILVHFLVTDSVWTLLSILWMLRWLNVLKYSLQKAITFWRANCCRLYQKLGAHICSKPEDLSSTWWSSSTWWKSCSNRSH